MTPFLSWTCHVCGDLRPDARISVHTRDISAEHNLPPGSLQENVRYCNDRVECAAGARELRFIAAPVQP